MQRKKQKTEDERKTRGPESGDLVGTFWLFDRKCPECGKNFCIRNRDMWAYKDGETALCSWHCLRAREARKEERATKRQSKAGNIRLSAEQRQRVVQMIEEGKSVSEICQTFGVGKEVVWYHKRKNRKKVENE